MRVERDVALHEVEHTCAGLGRALVGVVSPATGRRHWRFVQAVALYRVTGGEEAGTVLRPDRHDLRVERVREVLLDVAEEEAGVLDEALRCEQAGEDLGEEARLPPGRREA